MDPIGKNDCSARKTVSLIFPRGGTETAVMGQSKDQRAERNGDSESFTEKQHNHFADVFKAADAKMYENKTAMKAKR